MYDERRDEGPQSILYSPAPGNRTEKDFTFALNLNALQGAFTVGGMCSFVMYVYIYIYIFFFLLAQKMEILT